MVVALGAVAAALAELLDSGGSSSSVVVLGAAIICGEIFVLRPAHRAPLPLSYAVFLVLLRAGSPAEFVIAVCVAELIALLFRPEELAWDRVWLTATRIG